MARAASILRKGAPRPSTKVWVEVHSAKMRAEHRRARYTRPHMSAKFRLDPMMRALSGDVFFGCWAPRVRPAVPRGTGNEGWHNQPDNRVDVDICRLLLLAAQDPACTQTKYFQQWGSCTWGLQAVWHQSCTQLRQGL